MAASAAALAVMLACRVVDAHGLALHGPSEAKTSSFGKSNIQLMLSPSCSSKLALEFGGRLLLAERPRQKDLIKADTTFWSRRGNKMDILVGKKQTFDLNDLFNSFAGISAASKEKSGGGTKTTATKTVPIAKYTNYTIDQNRSKEGQRPGLISPCLNREL